MPLSPLPSPPRQTLAADDPGVGVLSLGEAAIRLRLSRAQLEKMIDAGKVESLPVGLTTMIPTREVVRLAGGGSDR